MKIQQNLASIIIVVFIIWWMIPCCCFSVNKSYLTLCDPVDCSTPGFPLLHCLLESAQTHVVESMMPSNHLILHHPLLLLPSIFLSIRVFSNESALHIRWPNYWSFSFIISPSNEHSGLISSRTDWFDLLAVQKTLKHLLQHHLMDGVLGLFKMGNAILFPELMADLISDDTNMLSFSFSLIHTHTYTHPTYNWF